MNNKPSNKKLSALSVGEALSVLNDDPRGRHALTYLDIIDAKVSAIFTFIGILIAAVIFFISNDADYAKISIGKIILSQKVFIFSSLAILITAALFSLSCIHIISIKNIVKRQKTAQETITAIEKVANSRRRRYLLSLQLTIIGTLSAAAAVFMSL